MCIFSGAVNHVAGTQIFARPVAAKQILVYSMQFQTHADVAMILPLPVPPGGAEDAVTFISLEDCPKFFEELGGLFLQDVSMAFRPGVVSQKAPPLVVQKVGAFEASFVPSIADFDRLDPRFRLPVHVWEELPHYHDWGFAVFKLRAGARATGAKSMQQVHPMAFVFPRRDRSQLFFPTVHVHDGQLNPTAPFDHEFYCQLNKEHPLNKASVRPRLNIGLHQWVSTTGQFERIPWEVGAQPSGGHLPLAIRAGILAPDTAVYRSRQRGMLTNEDTIIGLES